MIKENKKTKRNILIIVIGLILIVAVVTLSYALWTRNFTQTGINKNIYDCFEINYEETKGAGVTLEHGYPQTDEEGMQNNPYEITVKNTCKTIATYNIILNKESSSTLNEQYLKVAVGDSYKKLNEYEITEKRELTEYPDFTNSTSYIIGTGVLTPDTTKIIDVRSWMDENTSVENGANKSFTFKITIEATAGDGELLAGKILKSYPITLDSDMENGFDCYEVTKANQTVNIDTSKDNGNGIGMCVTDSLENIKRDIYSYEMFNYECNKTDPASHIHEYTFGNNDNINGWTIYEILEATGSIITKANITDYSGYDIEEGIVATNDDDGTSYVLRGKVKNNYVKFAGQDWRIVRINGDGTIRLILKDRIPSISQAFNTTSNGLKYVGYTYDNDTNCTTEHPCKSTYTGSETFDNSNGGTNSDIKTYLEEWYNTNLKDKDSQIAYGTYCNDTTISKSYNSYTYYGSYGRIEEGNGASLQCPDTKETYGGVYKLKIGFLTADEMNIAGLPMYEVIDSDYYMYHNYDWWSMSPYRARSSDAYGLYGSYGNIYNDYVTITNAVLPVINLKPDVQITGGDGTESNPYVVD